MGAVPENEMYKTFNMGIGMALAAKQSDSQKIIKRFEQLGEKAFIIGRVEKGNRVVEYKSKCLL
jgi:phosphoribosylformylglycinamidine cyclo-ligase